jgi:hypothetical protein
MTVSAGFASPPVDHGNIDRALADALTARQTISEQEVRKSDQAAENHQR